MTPNADSPDSRQIPSGSASRVHAPLAGMDAPAGASALVDSLQAAGEKLRGHLRPDERAPNVHQAKSLISAVTRTLEHYRDLCAVVRCLRALPPPGAERDPAVGSAIFPLVMLLIDGAGAHEREQYPLELYRLHHSHWRTKALAPELTDWQAALATIFDLSASTKGLPDMEFYLSRSPSQSGPFAAIRDRRDEIGARIKQLEEQQAKSRTGATSADVIAKLTGDVRELNAKLPELFGLVQDVHPETMPEVLGATSLAALVKRKHVDEFGTLVLDLERLTAALANPKLRPAGQNSEVRTPYLTRRGDARHDTVVFTPEEFGTFGKGVHLAQVIELYLNTRAELRSLVGHASTGTLRGEPLDRPFGRFGPDGEEVWNILTRHPTPAVQTALVKLIDDPIPGKQPAKAGRPLDLTVNLTPLVWASNGFLSAGTDGERAAFHRILSAAPTVSVSVLPALEAAAGPYRNRATANLAVEIVRTIHAAKGTASPFELLTPVILLTALQRNPDLRRALKEQISNVDDLPKLAEAAERLDRALGGAPSALARAIIKNLKPGLSDYCQDEDGRVLMQFVERYKVYLAHPEIRSQISGNMVRSGVLLQGVPGVGKTFFANCLKTELEMQMFVISPEHAELSSSNKMIDACRKVVKEAIASAEAGKPCMLFIDEAEAFMADRAARGVTQDQVELTCYLLQIIDMIRVKYPTILIVAATNYIDRIDDGMLRDGRFDYHVELKPPNGRMRELLLRQVFLKEGIDLELNDGQMGRLVELTDGFIPLTILQAVTEYNRLERKCAELRGDPFEINFDTLVTLFTDEKARIGNSVKRRLAESRKAAQGS